MDLAGLLMPTKDRRKRLFSGKRFWCQCPRCTDDDVLRPFDCPKCGEGVSNCSNNHKRSDRIEIDLIEIDLIEIDLIEIDLIS